MNNIDLTNIRYPFATMLQLRISIFAGKSRNNNI